MKKNDILALLLLLGSAAQAQNWPEIKPEARPGSRWWWMGSAVDKQNLSYNLRLYGTAGIGSLEITPIYGVKGNEQREIPFLSPRWMEMLEYTQDEAKKNGIGIDMNTGTGWPFGGPDITLEHAATRAIFEQYSITGGKDIVQDISISNPKEKKQREIATLNRLMAYSTDGTCLNLTEKVKNGKLKWSAPKGEWKLIALFIGKTFQKVKRAAPGGEGYVMDHMNPEAVKGYFTKFDHAFQQNKVTYPRTFFNDSYEVYKADWTPHLLEEFERRRGYKLEEHFPEFLDTTRTEATRRIVSDYRETVSEMLIDNFTTQWTKWAHKHGSTTRNQAHGSPANLIDTYASVDIPECEGFGLTDFHIKGLRKDSLTRPNFSDISMLKYASSAAHIAGKPYTSSETSTWLTEHFRTSLSQCKPDMDLMFVSGVNHMFFHGTPYSPQEAAWPGWLFYASINMSPTNSIWRDAPAFFEYITRCQSFLQMGQPDNDFLVYLPIYDLWDEIAGRLVSFDIHKMDRYAPKFIKTIQTIIAGGYDVDYISDAFIKTTRCTGDQLVTSGGTRYKALIVPAARLMPAATLRKLIELARQGATVIFVEQYPEDVPGYHELDKNRKTFQHITRQLPATDSFKQTQQFAFGKGQIIVGSDYQQALAQTGIPAEELKTRYGLQFIRRSNPEGHHYFVSCLQDKDTDGWVTLNVPETTAMFFNPMNVERGRAQSRTSNGKLEVRLQLKSGESLIIQTLNKPLDKEPAWNYPEEQAYSLSLDHGWKLNFVESTPSITGRFDIDSPLSWTELEQPEAKINMGTGCYSLEIDLPALEADDWILDLGDVRESARVRINGHDAGTAWAAPFRLKVGKWLKTGKNLIEVEVTNLPANRIADMDRKNIEWRIFKDINMAKLNYVKGDYKNWSTMPSGLNGNVRLIPVKYSKQ
ncbi:glycosyl hydrolase [Phocaeicola sp.]|uniref:alpha-L-rhamnosidase n=1 Tax=Phocaeicola sp. TaxID=2773926 RepID=UPI003AB7A8D1